MTNLLVVESFSELPDDLVVIVMSKLPVKSLVRFKTVCKSWKHLIESPVFIDMHLRRTNPQRCGIYSSLDDKPIDDLSQEKPQPTIPVRKGNIVGACNGIICLKPSLPEKRLLVYNPSSRECSYIPDALDGKHHGFCYLPKTQEYQIISFSFHIGNKKVDMMILTLGNTKYMRNVKDVTVPGQITVWRKATCGTTFAWLGTDDDGGKEILISYDAFEERFSTMDLPPSLYPSIRSLSVLDDSVIMFDYPEISATFFDIWILVDDISKGKSWSKYKKIGPLETKAIMEPISVGWYRKSILFFNNTIGDENKSIFCYDLETDEVKDHKMDGILVLDVVNEVQSLVSMKSLGLDATYY